MTPQPGGADSERKEPLPPRDVIPYRMLNVIGEDCPSIAEVLSTARLPSLDQARPLSRPRSIEMVGFGACDDRRLCSLSAQVLDNMGIGPSGPPVPPPVTLSIVPFPKSRQQVAERQIFDCFTFLLPSKSDDAKRESEEDEPSPVKVKKESHRGVCKYFASESILRVDNVYMELGLVLSSWREKKKCWDEI